MSTATAELRVREADGEAPSAAREARALPGSPSDAASIRYAKRCLPHFERPWAKYAVAFSTYERRILMPEERSIVMRSIRHGHERLQYELYVVCIMPDHVHILLEPGVAGQGDDGTAIFLPLGKILQAIKSTTAHRTNKLRQVAGHVWDKESFDRVIRSEADLHEKFYYICRNPCRSAVAGPEEDYPWLWTPESEQIGMTDSGSARASRAGSGASPEPLPST